MYQEEFEAVSSAAQVKRGLLKRNPAGYILLSMLAGMYIGFGVLLAFTIGGLLTGNPAAKIVMGASFGVALSLVVMAGAELFTGNNLVMAAGTLTGKISYAEAVKLLLVCYLGNWVGALFLALLYHLTGLCQGAVEGFMAAAAYTKMTTGFLPLLTRGILCNFLVCIAAWCAVKCKSESGKLIMIFWCLIAFFTTGFEHSIANMTLLTVALLHPAGQALSLQGYFFNILTVTLGNMIGGIVFAALPYFIAAREKE